MKELTIEEKANCYDEAIETAKSKIKNDKDHVLYEDDIIEIFPELKESEDESIRKWLIRYFQEYKSNDIEGFANGLKIDSIVAWLEKQINDEDIHLLKLKAKAYDDSKERMSHAYDANRVPLSFANEIFPNINLYKTQDNELVYKNNKIKLKFKVGDWIVFNGLTLYINKLVKGYYRTISKDGIPNSYDWDIDNAARLWSIKDAKDGNILASKDGRSILIFKNLDTSTSFSSYYNIKHKGELGWSTLCFIPATKEQRNLLFQTMKEEGYKWDEDKKELIKL